MCRCQKTSLKEDLSDGYGYLQLSMIGNPIGDIINAFQHSLIIKKEYAVKEEYSKYLEKPTIDFDFSKRENGKLICILTGHLHCSFITTPKEYNDQLTITVPSGSNSAFERQNDDIKPTLNDDNFYILRINTINKKINIKKIGSFKTENGEIRDKIELNY